jgi:hypothetical protein
MTTSIEPSKRRSNHNAIAATGTDADEVKVRFIFHMAISFAAWPFERVAGGAPVFGKPRKIGDLTQLPPQANSPPIDKRTWSRP